MHASVKALQRRIYPLMCMQRGVISMMDHNSVSFGFVPPGTDRLSHGCSVDEMFTSVVAKFTAFLRAQEKDNLMQNERAGEERDLDTALPSQQLWFSTLRNSDIKY